jgi:hypothetical protein
MLSAAASNGECEPGDLLPGRCLGYRADTEAFKHHECGGTEGWILAFRRGRARFGKDL